MIVFGQQGRITVLDITIKIERPRVESLFAPYRTLIGNDFDGYRNHVYRCVTYAMHFLGDAAEYEQIVETAFVYHDIGLWTDKELAYLEPSEAVALHDNHKYGWGLDPDALRGAIHWHHKVFKYKAGQSHVGFAFGPIIALTRGWASPGVGTSSIWNRIAMECPHGQHVSRPNLQTL